MNERELLRMRKKREKEREHVWVWIYLWDRESGREISYVYKRESKRERLCELVCVGTYESGY